MRILLCNDDGIQAHGLWVLYKILKNLGTVIVVAPTEEKSTTGHSLTLHKPLRVIQYPRLGKNFYGVTGSPADCVNLGVRELMKQKPDWIVSGINRGANLGQDVYYSGTVSAAREAAMMGFRAMAISLVVDFKKPKPETELHFETAAKLSRKLVQQFNDVKLPYGTVLNLNVPDVREKDVKGLRLAFQGFRHYSGGIWKRRDHRGKDYFWVGGTYSGFKNEKGTDCYDTNRGYATLTPLEMDCTDHRLLAKFGRMFPQMSSEPPRKMPKGPV